LRRELECASNLAVAELAFIFENQLALKELRQRTKVPDNFTLEGLLEINNVLYSTSQRPDRKKMLRCIRAMAAQKATRAKRSEIEALLIVNNKKAWWFTKFLELIVWNRNDRHELLEWANKMGLAIGKFADIPQPPGIEKPIAL